MKISSSKLMRWSVVIAVFYFYFYPQLLTAIGGKYCYIFLFACIIFSGISLFLKNRFINDCFGIAWLFILIFSTLTNYGIQRGDWLWPITFIMLIILLFAATTDKKWQKTAIKVFTIGSLFYCTATIVFWAIPSIYSGMIQFWKSYPNGTEMGLYGYRAGFADNHSANGTYCIVAFLIASSCYFLEKNGKNKKILITISIISLGAVLLTTKRAHLLFGCSAAIVCYYFSQNHGKLSRGFKSICVVVVGLLIFYYASAFTPIIADFIEGFEGQEDLSNGRYEYWKIAFSYFRSSPILGIGWLGFRYKTWGILARSYVDAHNVYIQLLAESGIVGTMIMLFIFGGTLIETIKMLNKRIYSTESVERKVLCISLNIQVFCLLYGFTGNFLYDRTCFIYMFACALCYCIKHFKFISEREKLHD